MDKKRKGHWDFGTYFLGHGRDERGCRFFEVWNFCDDDTLDSGLG